LSYTTFSITWSDHNPAYKLQTSDLSDLTFRATVNNTGNLTGDEVVLAFALFNSPGPLKQLFGFQRVHLNPGESKEVFFPGGHFLDTVAKSGDKVINPGHYKVQLSNGRASLYKDIVLLGESIMLA